MTTFLRIRQVMARTGFCKATIYNLANPEHANFDPEFPRRIPIGARSVAWSADEVEAWAAGRIAKRAMP
jgi:predicted DNA-binding transcriptional regulator AlpA